MEKKKMRINNFIISLIYIVYDNISNYFIDNIV